jgi:hypothetical protein
MFSSERVANYRTACIARLNAEQQENDVKIAQLEASNAALETQLARLELPLPKPNACVICFYEHGITAEFVGAPVDPREPGVDRFQCPRCGYET